jgi:hypothetical protein
VGKGYTRTVTLLFLGLFHYFVTFAGGAQQLIFRNLRLGCVQGRLLLRPSGHDGARGKLVLTAPVEGNLHSDTLVISSDLE